MYVCAYVYRYNEYAVPNMQMLYKDMFHVDEDSIPDTRVHSDDFEQQGASFETLPPCQSGPKLGQQHSLMSNPDDWPDALFTPSVVDLVTTLMKTDDSASASAATAATAAKNGSVTRSTPPPLLEFVDSVETSTDEDINDEEQKQV